MKTIFAIVLSAGLVYLAAFYDNPEQAGTDRAVLIGCGKQVPQTCQVFTRSKP